MTAKTKRRLLKALDFIIVVGVIASVTVGIILLHQQKSNQDQNHNDTINVIKELQKSNDQNSRIIICMLQVPIAQRTPNLEANCRKVVNEQQQNGSTSADPTATPTIVTTTVPATSSSPSSPATANVSTPAETPRTTTSTSGKPTTPSAPAPQPGLVKGILNNVTDTIKNIL